MTDIVFKTIWQSDELSQVRNTSQEQIRCKGDMSGVNLEHTKKEKKWLFTKKKKSVSFHGTERNKIIDDAQLSCPELRRSAASTNVSALNLSCDKESTDSAESLDSRKCQSPVVGAEGVKVHLASKQLNVSPCAIFLETVEKNKNATNSLKEYTRKLEGKHKKLENLLNKLECDRRTILCTSLFLEENCKQKATLEVEKDTLQQRPLAVEEKLMNLCQKVRKENTQWRDILRKESEGRLAGTSERKAGRQPGPGNPPLQILEQITRSMSDLRQALTSQLNEIKEKSNLPGTSSNLGEKEPNISPIMLESVRDSLDNVVDKYQSKTAHQRDRLKMLSQFDGKFEAFNQQWERTQQEHQRTTQMIHELKREVDSIANTSRRMFSAFDQIQENIHNLGHIKPLIENIQRLLERRKNQQSIEERYLRSINERSKQGEALQRMVDQAVLPLVETIRRCHHPFVCSDCSGNCKHKMIMP
ncbi:testis-specific serine kinase substrate-like isoform X1 [Scyliorhinus torazame]|uniref:testis-specific serine kinase substrate-like isoform X1 n=1 Tax=Scyliorhinus torazame TaxID=75743 RepID=UPI003B5BA6C9